MRQRAAWRYGACACLPALLAALYAAPAAAQATIHARLDQFSRSYDLHADLTYVETVAVDYTIRDARGLTERERSAFSFYPASQSLQVVEAWVQQPDGSRIAVPDSSRFTRPSASAQNAPGFTGAMTTTLLYPQLRDGSHTHVVWRLVQRTPPLLGFDIWAEPPLDTPVGLGRIAIDAPAEVLLHWAARGGFEVSEHVQAGRRRIEASIRDTQAAEPEREMVDSADFQPLFLVTSLARLQDIGATYWRQSHDKAVVTPEISALAAKLAGGRTGEDAARAVYDWVTANIRYVAVYLDPNDGWVPHQAQSVLEHGYGDCKDHVVLMQALLGSLGIEAEAAMVDWGDRTTEMPLWLPQFNHAIVYLPEFDRYLNPTNPYARYGSLDVRLAGKLTVLATPLGAVGHTPAGRPQDNVYAMDSQVSLGFDGSIDGAARFALSANLESQLRGAVAAADSPQELAGRLLAMTPEGGFGRFSGSEPRDLSQPFSLVASWHSPHAVDFQDRQAYLAVPMGPDVAPPVRLRKFLVADGVRQHAMIVGAGDYRWSTTLRPPRGADFASLPAAVDLHNDAGSYSATYTRDGAAVRVQRRLVIGHDVFQAGQAGCLEALVYAALQDARATLVVLGPETVAGGE